MGLEKYNHEIVEKNYKRKKRNKALFVFLLFSVVVGIIFFSSFYNGGIITGNSVKKILTNDSMQISTSLSVPEVFLKDSFEEVFISAGQEGLVYIDDKKISLKEIQNNLSLKDFSGSIKLNGEHINLLEGKISEIKINNVSINLQGEGRIKLVFNENTPYEIFEIKEGVFLEKVFFVSSGEINFEEDSINLKSEKVSFENYFGGLKVKDKKLILNGFAEKITIDGDSRKIVLSKK
jgi:hypothetical protein